ncbi:hypothetical protein [Lentzea sp. CA-135723]|uniref:hypothetical protein n=1 Tax=Lentzea sp. CA-135723 TaxID=3239950 RepID=UPI003D91CC35
MDQPWVPGRAALLGDPPDPGRPGTLAEFGTRLRALRDWSQIGSREMPAVVGDERRRRGLTREATRSYTTMFDLFRENRKRYDEDLLFDTVRALLRAGNLSQARLEELTRSWREAYHAARQRKPRTDDYPRFRLGPLTTSCQILEGNGERAIDRDSVRVVVAQEDVVLPPYLAAFRDEVAREQEERRRAGKEHFWNAPRYAVADLVVSRRGADESPDVTLHLKNSDYFNFIAAQQLDRPLEPGGTLRTRYLDGRDVWDTPDFLRSSFGVNIAVVTADGHLVVSRRSSRVGVGKNVWNSSANEGLQRELDGRAGASPDLHAAAQRGLAEELRLDPAGYRLSLLAFAAVTSNSHWCCFFQAELTTMTLDGFRANLGRGAQDAWENRGFDFVPFTPESVVTYLLRDDRRDLWAPAAPPLFYLSLVHSFGRDEVDRCVDRLTGAAG